MFDQRMLGRVESLIEKGEQVEGTERELPSNYVGFENPVETAVFSEWRSQSSAFLINLLGPEHSYVKSFEDGVDTSGITSTRRGIGVLRAVRSDLRDGYLATLRELVHADVFDDFLEMAGHLVKDGGYKDAAAVIAGSTLEGHLRKLCQKSGIATTVTKLNGSIEPKKASILNDELRKQAVYNQIEWRALQGYLDIRNDAAHGDYNKYTKEQVIHMIDGIRGFLARNPA